MKERILLTGAAGIVGRALRPELAGRHREVLLTDLEPITDLAANERFEAGDIQDLDFVRSLARQVDGIVHLAGLVGAAYTFDQVLGPNIIGTHHVYEAARSEGVPQVVYASSHHAVGFMRRGEAIDHLTPHRPDSEYGLSKAFGESAGAYYADKFGLNILSIRIGYVGDEVSQERRLHTWISARDLAQLIEIGLDTPELGHQIVYGVSDNPDPFFDNANAHRLGYRPQDRASDQVTDPALLDAEPDLTTLVGATVGGGFGEVGFEGNLDRIIGTPPPNS